MRFFQNISIRKLISGGPIILLLVLAVAMGFAQYQASYKTAEENAVQLAMVGAKPVLNLLKLAVGGGNYANAGDDAALGLYRANENLLFFSVKGKTDQNATPYSFVYEKQSGRIFRSAYPAGYGDKLKAKVEKARTLLAKLPQNHKKRPKIKKILAKIESGLNAFTAGRDGARKILERHAMPPAEKFSGMTYLDNAKNRLHVKMPTGNKGGGTVWMVFDVSSLANLWKEVLGRIIPLAAALLLLSVIAALLITRAISRPIVRMAQVMEKMANGDLEQHIPGLERKDELGRMAKALQIFRDNGLRMKEMEAERKRIRQESNEERCKQMHELASDFETSVGRIVEQVSQASSELYVCAEDLTKNADDADKQTASADSAASQTSQNVQTVASAAEELSASISEISGQVQKSAEMAAGAVCDTREANEKVQGLDHAVQKIGKVVELITSIAEKTNLLALNATIEAARAGEAGKGFAVVASEVKTLASQTAKATDEISSQIDNIQSATTGAVNAIQGIGSTIEEMDTIAASIASAMEQQGAATQEIAVSVDQAANGTRDVSDNISGVTRTAARTGQLAGEILTSSGELSRQSDVLREEVTNFLAQVRTG